MVTHRHSLLALLTLALLTAAPIANAQWAVVDVGAITQLIQQIQVMREQLTTARDQLTQERQAYAAMTGTRQMQRLLRDVNRNYLPATWAEIATSLHDAQGARGALAADIGDVVQANAVLSPVQVAGLSIAEREDLEQTRRTTAMLQALARRSLASTSERFGALEQLIDAIASAGDQKAILDLQARIDAEAVMLANEQTKLEVLQRAAEAESYAHRQRLLERAIEGVGSLRRLPPLGL